MKRFGLGLITAASLAGAYLAVLDHTTVSWPPFLALLAAGFVGVFVARRAERRVSAHEDRVAENTRRLRSSLDAIVAGIAELDREKDTIDVYDLPATIDRRLVDHLNAFADSRETIKHAYGLQAFADVMSHFAGGERYLNRVWSAAADGYIDEAHEYIGRAHGQFDAATAKLAAAEGATAQATK